MPKNENENAPPPNDATSATAQPKGGTMPPPGDPRMTGRSASRIVETPGDSTLRESELVGGSAPAKPVEHVEGKKLHDETPKISAEEVLNRYGKSTGIGDDRESRESKLRSGKVAPILHAPTVTAKGKLGYMPTPSVPVDGIVPGVTGAGAAKPDAFVQPVVPTAITKTEADDDQGDSSRGRSSRGGTAQK